MPSFLDNDTTTFYRNSRHAIPAAAGATVQAWDGMNVLNCGTSALATLTVVLPPTPAVNEVVTLIPDQAVTALTLKGALGSTIGTVTSLAADTEARVIWNGSTWFKLSP